MNSIFRLTLLAGATALVACSSLETDKVDYRSTSKAPSLAVPPDLTQLSNDSRYALSDGTVSAVGLKAGQPAADRAPAIGATSMGDVRIERAGNQRWIVVKRPADRIWPLVKDFWQENGLTITKEQRQIGIMETDWSENRAKLPRDLIRAALGKVIDSLSSTGERDMYRTRLETTPAGDTEIYISHRGIAEVYTTEQKDQTAWQRRTNDPDLEAEFLLRLMVKLGNTPDQARNQLAVAGTGPVSSVTTANGRPALRIQEGFERAWRRVGLSLDRTGFSVDDRDRKQGIYFVRFADLSKENNDTGLFSRLFGSKSKPEAVKYQILVRGDETTSTVTVMNAQGEPENSDTARNIVKVLAEDIK